MPRPTKVPANIPTNPSKMETQKKSKKNHAVVPGRPVGADDDTVNGEEQLRPARKEGLPDGAEHGCLDASVAADNRDIEVDRGCRNISRGFRSSGGYCASFARSIHGSHPGE
jgi:hypothetical protein